MTSTSGVRRAPSSGLGLVIIAAACAACGGGSGGDGPARDGGVTRDGGPTIDACALWRDVVDDRAEGLWSGEAATCDPGQMEVLWRARALAALNAYRALVGLPAVAATSERNTAAMECALLLRANGRLSSLPPDVWDCYTEARGAAATESLQSERPAVEAVFSYVVDRVEGDLELRRTLLSSSLGPVGIGSTDTFSCLHVEGGTGAGGPEWVAFPPPGRFPIDAGRPLDPTAPTLDETGLSIHSDTLDLDEATVEVTDGDDAFPVAVMPLRGPFPGTALRLVPDDPLEVGHTYRVRVSNVSLANGDDAFEYAFEVVDCAGT